MSKPGKTPVGLASGAAPRASRIRRNPPPPAAKQPVMADVAEREAWTVVIGVVLFAMAITVIIFGAGNYLSR